MKNERKEKKRKVKTKRKKIKAEERDGEENNIIQRYSGAPLERTRFKTLNLLSHNRFGSCFYISNEEASLYTGITLLSPLRLTLLQNRVSLKIFFLF